MGAPLNSLPRNLLGIASLEVRDINAILDRTAEHIKAGSHIRGYKNRGRDAAHLAERTNIEPLSNLSVINLFMENSTRTRVSFELAAKRLGAEVTSIAVAHSSIRKGETLIDTAQTLRAMEVDLLVVRHPHAGAVQLLSEKLDCHVINAGDGFHEHPTQALSDAATIQQRKGKIEGLKVAICGDIRHSRVARSNILLLQKMKAQVRVVAPPTLLPDRAQIYDDVEEFTDMREGLTDCDIVMMLRLQTERMQGIFVPSIREYFHFYGLDREKLAYAKQDALVMHPGPMNRGVEIDSNLADDLALNLVHDQVRTGVAVRMSCLELLWQGSSSLEKSNSLEKSSSLEQSNRNKVISFPNQTSSDKVGRNG